jgi:hypothetical protein
MFEGSGDAGTAALTVMLDGLRRLGTDGSDVEDGVRIDRIRLLEELKSAAAAVQAVETAGSPPPNAPP